MKKIFSSILVLSLVLTFSACGTAYTVDKMLTPEQAEKIQAQLDEKLTALENLDPAVDSEIDLTRSVAINYERLGHYDKAIPYYERVLEIDEIDFVALNNLMSIYEEVGDFDLAGQYMVTLFNNFYDRQGVVTDAVRIFLARGEVDNATRALEEYARKYQSPETASFINEQFNYIQRVSKKLEEEAK